MTPALQKLAALGAYAVSAGLVVVLAFFIWLMWPVPTGGENPTVVAVGVLCVLCPVALLIVVHVVLARKLTHPD
jgi:hypothetical protein